MTWQEHEAAGRCFGEKDCEQRGTGLFLKAIRLLFSHEKSKRSWSRLLMKVLLRCLRGGWVNLSKNDLNTLGDGRGCFITVYCPHRNGKSVKLDALDVQLLKLGEFISQ